MTYPQSPRAEKDQTSSGRSARASDTRPDPRSGVRPTSASVHTLHAFGRKGDEGAIRRPSTVGRMLRGFIRLVVTILIGVGATLAWQNYGDVAREMVAAQAPTLASWLPPTRLPAGLASLAPALQPQPSAVNLDAVRRGMEVLAARQDQMAQSLGALLAIEADVRQKMSFTPPSAATVVQPAPVQQYRPAQPRVR